MFTCIKINAFSIILKDKSQKVLGIYITNINVQNIVWNPNNSYEKQFNREQYKQFRGKKIENK